MTRTRLLALLALALGCGGSDGEVGYVRIRNDFSDPAVTGFQPPWTVCRSSYRGVSFDGIAIGDTSAEGAVSAGLDRVLMVAAWNDPSCSPLHALPIASAQEEEVVPGQHRTITIGRSSHQGPCPPEGVAPMSREVYDRILALWPEYAFRPYDQRAENPQCLP